MTKSTREQATDTEIQVLIDSHEKGTAMFVRTDAYYFMAKELQERRKAERDSEPVAYTDERNLGYIDRGRETAYLWGKQNSEVGDVSLYRHAQQPVVPDKMSYQDGVLFVLNNDMSSIERGTVAMRAWNACRAAMLQAGNSPVIGIDLATGADKTVEVRYVAPPGYVMVPKEPTEAMINAWLSEVANWRGHVAGYKAMLAAAPQEVKGES